MVSKAALPANRSDAPPGFFAQNRALILIVALATLAAYLPVLTSGGYIWDDDSYLTENQTVQNGLSGLRKIWAIHVGWDNEQKRLAVTAETPQYYPLVFTSFWLEHKLWGLWPAGYHAVNVLLHICNALLVWRLADKLRIPAAWLIGAIFALHPVHVESVAWVTERKNVLSALFYLLAFGAYLRFDDTRQWKWYGATVLLFVFALLSKTITATLPVVILLALFYRKGRWTIRDWLCIAPLLAIGVGMGLLTAHLERIKVGAEGEEWSQTLFERTAIIAPSAFAFYAGKILWPAPLIFIYPRWEIHNAPWTAYLPFLLVLGGFAVAAAGVRRWGWGPLLLLIFSAVTLFPALGFLNVFPHRYSFVADHFQYLGSLGFIILFVATASRFFHLWRSSVSPPAKDIAVAAGLLATLGVLTFRQGFQYKNEISLWDETLRANPNAWIAMINLGNAYYREGRRAEAVRHYERALKYPVAEPEAHGCLGNALFDQGQYDEAIGQYRLALAARSYDYRNQINLGAALQNVGRFEESEEALRAAINHDPKAAMAWRNLARLRTLQDRAPDAVEFIVQALRLEPQNLDYRAFYGNLLLTLKQPAEAEKQFRFILAENSERLDAGAALVVALWEQGRYADALRICEAGLQQFPREPKLLWRLAWLRAASPDDSIRNASEALRVLEPFRAAGGQDPAVLDVVAMAAADMGDFQMAANLAQKALDTLASQPNNPDLRSLKEGLLERLEGYRASQPYRHTPASQPADSRP